MQHQIRPYFNSTPTLIEDVIERLPQLSDSCAYLKQEMQDKLVEHKAYIRKNGEDMPEIRNWKWQLG